MKDKFTKIKHSALLAALCLILALALSIVAHFASGVDDWGVILINFFIWLIVLIVLVLSINHLYDKIIDRFNNCDYNYVINHKWQAHLHFSNSISKHYIYYAIAMSYLEYGNENMFCEYINKINHSEVEALKYFSLIVYHAHNKEYGNLEELKEKYRACHKQPKMQKYDAILDILEKKNNNIEYSDEDMQIIRSIKSKVLKDLLI